MDEKFESSKKWKLVILINALKNWTTYIQCVYKQVYKCFQNFKN